MAGKTFLLNRKKVEVSHPEKLIFEEEKFSKEDLANYYIAIWERAFPEVKDHPLVLIRCPDGIRGQKFFQKHPSFNTSKFIPTVEIQEEKKKDTYYVVKKPEDLLHLVQMNAVELHLWNSTVKKIESPDRMIFDLDPDEGLPSARVVEAAILIRNLLAKIKLKSFVKSSGGKGLHVVVPLTQKHSWDEVKDFAEAISLHVVSMEPALYTATMSKAKRKGKIFIDYFRNTRGATSIANYSPRARPGAPVSVPLSWRELKSTMKFNAFTIKTLPRRLKSLKKDPWEDFASTRQSLPNLKQIASAG